MDRLAQGYYPDGKRLLTPARVVLHQELVERHPSTSNANHHGAAQDSDEPELLRVSKLGEEERRPSNVQGKSQPRQEVRSAISNQL